MKPVFILGAGRSGTKFLRNLLGASEEVAVIPYDVEYVWRYGNEGADDDELHPDMATEKTVTYIRRTLPRLSDRARKPGARFLLEKSVANTLRPLFLHRIFPNAYYLHLVRDGRAVTESSIRMWQTPPEKGYLFKKLRYFPLSNYRYAIWYGRNLLKGVMQPNRAQDIWGPRYKGIQEDLEKLPLEVVCARQWRRCVEICMDQLETVPKHRILDVRYESLVTDRNVLEAICEFMGLKNDADILSFYDRTVTNTNLRKWEGRLPPVQQERIDREIGRLMQRLGYTEPTGDSW